MPDISYLLGHDEVKDASHHSPGVVHIQVDLLSKLDGFELLGAEDDVPGAVLNVVSGDVPELQVVRASEDTLHGPLGQLAGVVLQLIGQDCTTLGVQLLPPINLRAIRVNYWNLLKDCI